MPKASMIEVLVGSWEIGCLDLWMPGPQKDDEPRPGQILGKKAGKTNMISVKE